MNSTPHRRLFTTRLAIAAGLTAAALGSLTPSQAQQTVERKNGDHPAIVVQRLHQAAGYDYASKFYPHPAWLYLAAEAPHELGDHPAVIVARRAVVPTPPAPLFAHPAIAPVRPTGMPTATAQRGD